MKIKEQKEMKVLEETVKEVCKKILKEQKTFSINDLETKITKYNGATDIDVQFKDNTIEHKTYGDFKKEGN